MDSKQKIVDVFVDYSLAVVVECIFKELQNINRFTKLMIQVKQ